MQEQEIELQISVNIGSQKFLIKVPKKADLSQFVRNFLATNRLNLKYQTAIISMVQAKLKEEQSKPQSKPSHQSSKEASISNESVSNQSRIQPKSGGGQNKAVRHSVKRQLLDKIKQELQIVRSHPPDSRMVYEQWKMREKEKNKPQTQSSLNEQSRIQKQTLSPDHFYRKGLEFKQHAQQNCQLEFKRLYPFKLTDKQTNEAQQSQLCQRLSKRKKEADVKQFLSNRVQTSSSLVRPKCDQVKQRVKEYDLQVDRMLLGMIRQGELTYAKYRPKSRSPFRKTVIN